MGELFELEPTGSASSLERHLLGVAEALGIEARQIHERAKASVDRERAYRIWDAALALTKDESLPARVAIAASEEPDDLVTFLCAASADLDAALASLERYFPLLDLPLSLALIKGASSTRIVLFGMPASRGSKALTECAALFLARTLKRVSGGVCRVRQVSIAHAAPANCMRHRACAEAPVTFDSKITEIEVHRPNRSEPLPRADRALAQFLASRAEHQLRARAGAANLVVRVEKVIEAELRENGSIEIELVARKLGMSKSTLHRRLCEQGTSYRAVRDEWRFRAAHAMLERHSIVEVALALGFSDARAFHRAFRRWTKTSPRAWLVRRSSPPPEPNALVA